MTSREQQIIHLCKKFMYGKCFLYRYVANAVARQFKNDKFSGPNLSPPIGPMLKSFPQRVRANRHHRRRFPVDTPPVAAKKVDGEFKWGWGCRPAVITRLH